MRKLFAVGLVVIGLALSYTGFTMAVNNGFVWGCMATIKNLIPFPYNFNIIQWN